MRPIKRAIKSPARITGTPTAPAVLWHYGTNATFLTGDAHVRLLHCKWKTRSGVKTHAPHLTRSHRFRQTHYIMIVFLCINWSEREGLESRGRPRAPVVRARAYFIYTRSAKVCLGGEPRAYHTRPRYVRVDKSTNKTAVTGPEIRAADV